VAIKIRKSHQGRLHRALHVSEGDPIPSGKLDRARHSQNMALRRMATFAANARTWGK
jgi:hypothetical protein